MSDSEWYFESSDSSSSSSDSSLDTSSSDSSSSDSSYEDLSSNCDDYNNTSLYKDDVEELSNCLKGLGLEASDKQQGNHPVDSCGRLNTHNLVRRRIPKSQLELELFGEISSSEDESDNFGCQGRNEEFRRDMRMKRRKIVMVRRRIIKN